MRALLTLLAVVCVALGCALCARSPRDAPAPRPLRPGYAVESARAELRAPSAQARSPRVAVVPRVEASALAATASAPRRQRVRGRVTLAGEAAHGLELRFRRVGDDGREREESWDFTGEDGAFGARLAPGSYVVRGRDGRDLARIELPAGEVPPALELELGALR